MIARDPPRARTSTGRALSPLVALLGGAIVVLLVGLLRPRVRARAARARPDADRHAGARARAEHLAARRAQEPRRPARWRSTASRLTLTLIFAVAGVATVLLVLARDRAARVGHGEYYSLLLTSRRRHGRARRAQNLVSLFLGLELLSIPLYVLCATEMRRETLARVGAEVPDHRLGRLGDAALRPGADLRRHRLHALRRDRGARSAATPRRPTCCCSPASRSSSSAWPSRPRSPRSTSGRPTSTRARRPPITAFMAVATKAAAFGVFLRFFDVALIDAQVDLGARCSRRWPRSRSSSATSARSGSPR